jgi:predicted MFS family arabinose efflux permease
MTPPPADGSVTPVVRPPAAVSPPPRRAPVLAALRHPGFRLQWPSDLAVSWAFEMETLILGWYVLTETGSVVWLTVFGALQFVGTLISPWYGLMGDRIGHRRVLTSMRTAYALIAAVIAGLIFAGALDATLVLVLATLAGLVRPSDIGVRNALIGASVPPALLMGAIGLGRTGMDAARIVGALTGAGLVALIGMGPAYVAVTALYLMSLALILSVPDPPVRGGGTGGAPASARRELVEGLAHVWTTPSLLAAVALAFLANLAAYPLSGGLLPYVAREVYGIDRTGLGYLVASFAAGGLIGSLLVSAAGARIRPARSMLIACGVWFVLLLAFARVEGPLAGMAVLALAGFAQSLCMVPMAVLLLRIAGDRYRGRVMGLRMMAIYGLPLGLLAAGPLVAWWGFAGAATAYAGIGLGCTLAAALLWWRHLWPRAAAANALRG